MTTKRRIFGFALKNHIFFSFRLPSCHPCFSAYPSLPASTAQDKCTLFDSVSFKCFKFLLTFSMDACPFLTFSGRQHMKEKPWKLNFYLDRRRIMVWVGQLMAYGAHRPIKFMPSSAKITWNFWQNFFRGVWLVHNKESDKYFWTLWLSFQTIPFLICQIYTQISTKINFAPLLTKKVAQFSKEALFPSPPHGDPTGSIKSFRKYPNKLLLGENFKLLIFF